MTTDPLGRGPAGRPVVPAPSEAAALPRTAVPAGITDPVASARAELKAALAAIEQKGNLPRRLEKATDRAAVRLRRYADHNALGAIALVVGVAAAVGGAVWGVARLLSR